MARPAGTASGSASSSPGASAAPTSSSFSSAPINPVVSSSHSRRHKSDAWRLNDSQNQNPDNSARGATATAAGDSPSSSGTQDEDIRSKPPRPSSAGSSSSKKDEAMSDDDARARGRQPPPANQNSSLPSLSSGSAALLQLREHQRSNNNSASPGGSNSRTSSSSSGEQNKLPPQSVANAGATSQSQMTALRRSGSRTREGEGNPLLPQDEDMNEEEDDDVDDMEDEDLSAPPSPTDRDVRIMFHGREIFAEDLIGLRVAKTFAGHGRFLGQVVKFDKRMALYTVVYADGDAEDLTVDSTLQILIQDEIERADPSQPPPAVSLLFKKEEDGASPAGPDTGDFMTPPPAPRQAPAAQRRTRIQVSEREAQFVISLFENHALPNLVRQGWRVQSSSSGRGDTRFMSPTGEIFASALDVVGYIASDNELLTACFPANVHSAILSLLPPEASAAAPSGAAAFTDTGSNHGSTGSASRKRTTSDSPSAEQLDGKRTRQARDAGYPLQMRGGSDRGGADTALYRPEDLDRRAEAASRISTYRGQGGMSGRIRMSGDRFVSGETTSEARIQAPPEARGYRRTSSREPTLENPFTSRWSGGESGPGRAESAEYARRFADSPGWRERGDRYASDRPLEAHPRIRAERRYIHQLSARNPVGAVDGGAGATGSGTPTGYYRDATGSSPGGRGSPIPNGLGYPQYSTMRPRAGDYRSSEMAGRTAATLLTSRETASFMSPTDTLGASAAFSLVDVDRIPKSRPNSAHMEQPRGRSPRQGEGQQSYIQRQSLQHHRRSSSGHSYHGQRGSDSQYGAEPASEAQGEQHNNAPSGAGSTPNQQQHE